MAKLKINDTGNNKNLKISINDEELNLKRVTGYELERTSDTERVRLKIIYDCYLSDIEIKVKKKKQL